jgi:hypothetical protein
LQYSEDINKGQEPKGANEMFSKYFTKEEIHAYEVSSGQENRSLNWLHLGIQLRYSVDKNRGKGKPDLFTVWTGKGQIQRFKTHHEGLKEALRLAAIKIAEREGAN